jgi:hypothetical protein
MPTLMLGDLPIRLDASMLADLLTGYLPWRDPERKLTRQESAMRIGLKAIIQAGLAQLEGEIRQGKLQAPPPGRCPKGEDFIEWGFRYILGVYQLQIADQCFEVQYGENPDGSLTLTGLGASARMVPAGAVVDSLPAGAPSAAAPALPAAPAALDGRLDSGEPVGSLVCGGVHGERQDPIRETVGEAAAAAVPVHESLHSGL